MEALKIEALKMGIPIPRERRYVAPPLQIVRLEPRAWKHETVTVRGKPQDRYRDVRTGRFVKKPL